MTDTATTKQCPFCAETIQAAAIVCKHCGRDLVAKPAPIAPTGPTDRQLIEHEVARLAAQGYRVVSQTETTAQVAKAKKWNAAGLVLFVLLPLIGAFLWGPLLYVAVFGLILVAADYALKKEDLVFLSADALRRANTAAGGTMSVGGRPHVRHVQGSYYCSQCNKGVRPDADTCKHCGASFKLTA